MAYNIYLEVEASATGAVAGNVSTPTMGGVDVSAWVECSEFTTDVTRPGMGSSGDTQGTFQCGDLRFVTKWGPDTPMFLQIITNNEALTGTFHTFFRNQSQAAANEAGVLEEQMTAAFVGGRLTGITIVSPNTLHAETANLAPWIEATISYNQLTFTHVPDGKEAVLDWQNLA